MCSNLKMLRSFLFLRPGEKFSKTCNCRRRALLLFLFLYLVLFLFLLFPPPPTVFCNPHPSPEDSKANLKSFINILPCPCTRKLLLLLVDPNPFSARRLL